MNLTKAVITAASPKQRSLPLQRLVDRDGELKSAIRIILDETVSAGIDEVCVIVHPGDGPAYEDAAGDVGARLLFVEQPEPNGYGHALLCAKEFVYGEAFLHLVSDHLWVARGGGVCAQRLVEIAQAEAASVSAVQPTREHSLPLYGVVGGQRVAGHKDLYLIDTVAEKPTPTEAEQTLIVPGLRAGHYLCFFGMHVLSAGFMELLEQALATGEDVSLAGALSSLASRERYLAFESPGQRFNLGVKYGLFQAQLALALSGEGRDEVLTEMIELLAQRELAGE
ncbi:MAG: sugar phosphate nucleotidyltransferase [Planctomycetota bacterium]|jgi:UTP--glucose-1-phosphate uridylyltransferase|nr:sugar phosphate nucleotidyltransferase [Planctomycetota bacterium]